MLGNCSRRKKPGGGSPGAGSSGGSGNGSAAASDTVSIARRRENDEDARRASSAFPTVCRPTTHYPRPAIRSDLGRPLLEGVAEQRAERNRQRSRVRDGVVAHGDTVAIDSEFDSSPWGDFRRRPHPDATELYPHVAVEKVDGRLRSECGLGSKTSPHPTIRNHRGCVRWKRNDNYHSSPCQRHVAQA